MTNRTKTVGTVGLMPVDIELPMEYSGKMVDNFSSSILLFLVIFRRPPWGSQQKLSQTTNYNQHFMNKNDPTVFWAKQQEINGFQLSPELIDLLSI